MSKVETQNLFAVSAEFRDDYRAEYEEIMAAVGATGDRYVKSLNGIDLYAVTEARWKGAFRSGGYKITSIKLELFDVFSREYVRRFVKVKNGAIDLDAIAAKVAELVALKAGAEARRATLNAKEKTQNELRKSMNDDAIAAGVLVASSGSGSLRWSADHNGLTLQNHYPLTVEQALQVQVLLQSFEADHAKT